MEELRRERGQWTPDRGEPIDEAGRYPRSRNPDPVAKPELGLYHDRGRFPG
jgi:hypothetical protein